MQGVNQLERYRTGDFIHGVWITLSAGPKRVKTFYFQA